MAKQQLISSQDKLSCMPDQMISGIIKWKVKAKIFH